MSLPEIRSEAFGLAVLRSERTRIVAMLVFLALMFLVPVVRALTTRDEALMRFLPAAFGLVAGFGLYELIMLTLVRRRLRSETDFPPWTWVLNVFVETLLPSVVLIVLTYAEFMGPYRALVAPATYIYFFFIILATLRLSPALCRLTGVFSAVGYLLVTAFTYWRFPDHPSREAIFGVPLYCTFGLLFLIGGFIAGAVAGQIRRHVLAALKEAEAKLKIERDLSIARNIQQGLLPAEQPDIAGFELAGWSQPADQTGGDYYDWQTLPDGRIAISLADVTGHGIGPALVTAVCRAYARASFPSGTDLGTLMDRINNLLVEDLPPDRFVTFVVGILDPAKARVQVLSAGHGPLFVYKAGEGTLLDYRAHGIPFGVADGFEYGSPQEIDFEPGDMLILVTDGFFEWANAGGEEFGIERLGATIREAKDLPPAEIIEKLYAA
ncbi:MAG: PP2C family protein-serine/threonine phosphatase, partial [Phycisphaerales bacterium]